ncbi:HlyD family type I secretion periplasmic adaptor subunit [Henriciella sp. AS95]|uniref:HlyD family type I secretion periplasmic adaptor subunit n=1 Tax=Henriciella sp. AS95 TaxID=3135782 RepID=UPI00316F0B72
MAISQHAQVRTQFRTLSARQLVMMGWGLIIILFGGLTAWSIFAPFEGAVIAQGQVGVATSRQAVQHLEGGIVDEIFVREFDRVEQGDPLIKLDTTQIDSQLLSTEARLFELLGEEARLDAEFYDQDDLEIQREMAEYDDRSKIQGILDEQTDLMQTRRQGIERQIEILQQRVTQYQVRIAGMHREIDTKDTQLALAQDEISRLEKLYENGHASLTRILGLKREKARVEGEKEALSAEIAATKVRIGEAEIEMQQLQQNFREEVQTRSREAKTQIEQLEEERAFLLDKKQRTIIRAPSTGRVIGVQAQTVRGVITPSQAVMFIVPEHDNLVARVQIAPTDIDKISIGQKAVLRFNSFNQNETPQISSTVQDISADVFSVTETGQTYYEVVVEIPMSEIENMPSSLIPGMPVEAMLRTEKRNVISYLLKPLTDSFSRTFRE